MPSKGFFSWGPPAPGEGFGVARVSDGHNLIMTLGMVRDGR